MIKLFIGPNGYGKTTALNNKRKELIDSGVDSNKIMFLPSEILVLDEIKDTTNTSFAMEYIISELLETTNIIDKRSEYSDAIDEVVVSFKDDFNDMLDEVIQLNGQTRDRDVISISNQKEYRKLLKIDSKEIKEKLGSGQRMQFILKMVKNSNKDYIFIDEPEKHSHPSLLNLTAKIIRELGETKEVFVATHSPKLIEMLNFNINDIEIYNDPTFSGPKNINLPQAIATLPNGISVSSLKHKSQTYYDLTSLEENIMDLHKNEFFEALFSKKVYLVEGINDELFLKHMLKQHGKEFEDYCIFRVFGKQHFLPFIQIFQSLNIDVAIFFDEDNLADATDNIINQSLSTYNHYMFAPDIENEIGYTGHKSNTVQFLDFLSSYTIDSRYDI